MEALVYSLRDANVRVILLLGQRWVTHRGPSVRTSTHRVTGRHIRGRARGPTPSAGDSGACAADPTLPPAAHTNVYLVGPDGGPWGGRSRVAVPRPAGRARAGPRAGRARGRASHPPPRRSCRGSGRAGGAVRRPIAAHAETAARVAMPIDRVLADGDVIAGLECVFTPGHARPPVLRAGRSHDCRRHGRGPRDDPDRSERGRHGAVSPIARAPARASPDRAVARARTGLARWSREAPRVHRASPDARGEGGGGARRHARGSSAPWSRSHTPTRRRLLWPLAERSLVAHLHKLVSDGRAREVAPGRWSATQSGYSGPPPWP